MIQHIVLFKLRDELSADEKRSVLERVKSQFEQLPQKISVLRKLSIRYNFNPLEEFDCQLLVY